MVVNLGTSADRSPLVDASVVHTPPSLAAVRSDAVTTATGARRCDWSTPRRWAGLRA